MEIFVKPMSSIACTHVQHSQGNRSRTTPNARKWQNSMVGTIGSSPVAYDHAMQNVAEVLRDWGTACGGKGG